VSAATSSGEDRETFGVGGASGITYQPLPGIVVGSSRAFPVRGFEAGELRGGTVAVGTVELRVPLALVAQPLGEFPYGLDRVSLRIFYDYGRVWEPPVSGLPHWIHSTGVEVTWDLLVLYDVPLRLRTGVATALNDGSVTRQGDLRFGLGFGSEF
jgi:outer membrane protein assembly factor BamA